MTFLKDYIKYINMKKNQMQNVKKCAIHSIFLQCNTCLISLIVSKTILQFVHTIECHYQIDTIYPVVQSTSAFKYLISNYFFEFTCICAKKPLSGNKCLLTFHLKKYQQALKICIIGRSATAS